VAGCYTTATAAAAAAAFSRSVNAMLALQIFTEQNYIYIPGFKWGYNFLINHDSKQLTAVFLREKK